MAEESPQRRATEGGQLDAFESSPSVTRRSVGAFPADEGARGTGSDEDVEVSRAGGDGYEAV